MNYVNYLLSRFFSNLLLPSSLPLIFIFLGIIKRKNKYLFIASSMILIFSVRLFSENIIRLVEYPWGYEKIENISSTNYVVVLSGGIKNLNSINGVFEWTDPDRFYGGLEILKYGKARKIIFTGANGFKFQNLEINEGKLLKEEAISNGISPNDIFVTGPIINTFEEAKEVKKILQKFNESKIILVTSAFHMNRALFIFKKHNISVIPYPVDFKRKHIGFYKILRNPYNWIPNAENLYISQLAIKEIMGIFYYRTYYFFRDSIL